MAEHYDEIAPVREVTGLIEFGMELKDSERKQIQSLGENLDPDFVLLKEGEEPKMLFSILMTLGGLALLGFWIFSWVGATKSEG